LEILCNLSKTSNETEARISKLPNVFRKRYSKSNERSIWFSNKFHINIWIHYI